MRKVIQQITLALFCLYCLFTNARCQFGEDGEDGEDEELTQVQRVLLLQGLGTFMVTYAGLVTFHQEVISVDIILNENHQDIYLNFNSDTIKINNLILSNMNITGSGLVAHSQGSGFFGVFDREDAFLSINKLIIENCYFDINFLDLTQYSRIEIGEVIIINSKFDAYFLRFNAEKASIQKFRTDLQTITQSSFPLIQIVRECLPFCRDSSNFEISGIDIPHQYQDRYPYDPDFLTEVHEKYNIDLTSKQNFIQQGDTEHEKSQKVLIENLNLEAQIQIVNSYADFSGNSIRFVQSLIKEINTTDVTNVVYQTTITDSVLKNMRSNKDGGAILTNGNVTLDNVDFVNCTSQRFGGALRSVAYDIKNTRFINCSSIIGGAIFTQKDVDKTCKLQNVTFEDNFASLTENDMYVLDVVRGEYDIPYYNFLDIDKAIQYSSEVRGTKYQSTDTPYKYVLLYLVDPKVEQLQLHTINGFFQVLLLKFNQLNSTNFTQSQAVGNLFDLLHESVKQNFNSIELDDIYSPYLVLEFNEQIDCLSRNTNDPIYSLSYLGPGTLVTQKHLGCMYTSNKCSKSMVRKSVSNGCQYCASGTFTKDGSKCETCNPDLFDQCYADVSTLKSSFWRSSVSDSDSQIQSCNLNSQSCEGENRDSAGNDLCSEGQLEYNVLPAIQMVCIGVKIMEKRVNLTV